MGRIEGGTYSEREMNERAEAWVWIKNWVWTDGLQSICLNEYIAILYIYMWEICYIRLSIRHWENESAQNTQEHQQPKWMKRLSDGKNLKPLFQFCVCFHNSSTFMAQHIQSLLILFHPTQNLSLVCPFSFHTKIFSQTRPRHSNMYGTNERNFMAYTEFSIAFFCRTDDGTV